MGSKRERMILLSVLIGSLLIAVASGATIYFVGAKAGDLKTANAGLHGRIVTAKNKLNKLNDMRVDREKAQARLVVSESILPSQREIETLVDNLSEFAKKSGVIITKAEPVRQTPFKATGGAKRFDEADFDLDLQGNFFQFVEFLNYLENYKRFIRVDKFSVSAGKTAGEAATVALSFATFTYVDAPAAPSPATPAAKGVTK
jgi:Tfp pilus assembly protein PilO